MAKRALKFGRYSHGHYLVREEELKGSSLASLEILCRGMPDQMSDAEIERLHKKTGDYDANEMYFNIWVNGFLIQFHYELMGLHVEYNAWELLRPGHCHTATLAIVSKTVNAVVEVLKDHCIEDISEKFYKTFEQSIARALHFNFKDNNRRKTANGTRRSN